MGEQTPESGDVDLTFLRAVAESSIERTPGRWEQGHGWVFTSPVYDGEAALSNVLGTRYYDHDRHSAETVRAQRNVEYIAAAQPSVMLAILDRLDDLELQLNSAKIANTAVWVAAERASRKGYDLDPDEVLEIITPPGVETSASEAAPSTPGPVVP